MASKSEPELKGVEKAGKEFGWKEELAEESDAQMLKTGFPAPKRRFRIVYESMNASVEETYYWLLTHLQQDQGMPYADKITDVFSASENSAFFGVSQSRLGIQQDRASQYLALVGKMVKDLFSLVRELRVLDERLYYYENWDKSKAADVTLKGLYVDLVEGGTKSPASVYGMAQNVGFTILPDLFFNTQVYKETDIDKVVDALEFNSQVKNVLKRKLLAFVVWKIKTHAELKSRRLFNSRYLRQHWGTIKMYMAWIKPYLRNIAKLTMKQAHMDSAEMVSAFETSMMELEVLIRKPSKGGYNSVVLMTCHYRTRPQLNQNPNMDYQRSILHSGRIEVTMRAYGWHDKEIEAYKKFREEESFEMLGYVDGGIKAAMEALGDDLNKYLEEAGDKIEKKDVKKELPPKLPGIGEPFKDVFLGFKEMFTAFSGSNPKSKDAFVPDKGLSGSAASAALGTMYQAYKNYKKSHGMLSW
jgi:hypothetical protein